MQPRIPLTVPMIGREERAAVDRVLASGMLAQGPEVEAFEQEFASIVDRRYCVAVNSGTSALHLALIAMGVGPGDEVIVPSFSFAASANAIRLVGAKPVFVDIDPATFCMDPGAVRSAITAHTTAIMPVHLYGHPAPMNEIMAIAQQHGLGVIEDAAQAHCARLGTRPVGSFGTTAAFSFYPTKNMTTAEGGMVVTADAQLARTVRLLRNQGMEHRYQNEIVGFNARMTDIQAAIGRVQLTRLKGWTEARQRNAALLTSALVDVMPPAVASGATHVFHQYTVRSKARPALIERLTARGIGYGIYYPTPIHRLPSFALNLDLPETELASREVLSLPAHPALSEQDLADIIEAVNT